MIEDLSKIGSFALLGDADPVPQSLFLSHPEQANTLALLYEVSREVTSILDRQELLRRGGCHSIYNSRFGGFAHLEFSFRKRLLLHPRNDKSSVSSSP